jgi:hypothetical protein
LKAACVFLIILSTWSQGQSSPEETKPHAEPKACNADVTFCWYGPNAPIRDEVRAWGNRWVSQDDKASPSEAVTEVRCIKSLMVCVVASNYAAHGGKRVTSVDLYYVTSWETTKIEARPEGDDPCREGNLQMNKIEQTVTRTVQPRNSVDPRFSRSCSELPVLKKTLTTVLMQ